MKTKFCLVTLLTAVSFGSLAASTPILCPDVRLYPSLFSVSRFKAPHILLIPPSLTPLKADLYIDELS